MKKSVLFITNLPAPYKIDFFHELGKYVDLTIAFERSVAGNRNALWTSQTTNKNFHEVWLSGITIGDEMSLDIEILAHLKKNKYDIILINGYSSPTEIIAILYLKTHKMNFGIVCDGLLDGKESFAKKHIKQYLVSAASYWLSSGKVTDDVLISHGANPNGIFRYPFSSIKNTDIVSAPYNREKFKDLIGCQSKYMILYVGQMIYRKGIDVLLEAFNQIDLDIQLYLIGGEVSVMTNKSDRVVNLGFLGKSELANYFKASDLFVLPSREDIWGLVVNEALGYGVPVIATNRCGAALEMIVDKKNGSIVPAEDSYILKKQIIELLQQTDSQEYMLNAVKTAQDYTIEKMAESIWNIICHC